MFITPRNGKDLQGRFTPWDDKTNLGMIGSDWAVWKFFSPLRKKNPARLEDATILEAMACPDFRKEVKRLAASSIRAGKSTGAVHALYREFSWHHRAMTTQSWLGVITFLNVFVIFIDYAMAENLLVPGLLLRAIAIPIVYLTVIPTWISPHPAWAEALSVIVFSCCMLALAGILGSVAGGAVYERYILSCFLVVSTGIAVVPLGDRWVVGFGACNCLAYAISQALNPNVDGLVVGLTTVFFAAVTSALVMARLSANRVHARSVMMHFRNVYQVEQLRQTNLQLQELATTDALTGILNRRSILERFQHAFASPNTSEALSVALVDVDHFKRLNDTLGHQEGDRCLRAVAASLLATATRLGGHVGRYGGEEFLLVLPGADIARAHAVCEQIRRAVEQLRLQTSDARDAGPVTVSIGAAATVEGIAVSPETLLQRADDALYAAKHAGRNVVSLAPSHIDRREMAPRTMRMSA